MNGHVQQGRQQLYNIIGGSEPRNTDTDRQGGWDWSLLVLFATLRAAAAAAASADSVAISVAAITMPVLYVCTYDMYNKDYEWYIYISQGNGHAALL